MTPGDLQRRMPAPYALPVSYAAFLAIGTVAAGLNGHMTAPGVLIACALVSGLMSFAAGLVASVPIAGIGWLTVAGFSRPPYAQLNPTAAVAHDAAVTIGACSAACACLGVVFRWHARRQALASMGAHMAQPVAAAPGTGPGGEAASRTVAIGMRRSLA